MRTGNITLLQMNDVHGYLEPHPELVWYGSEPRYPILGGYARMATLVCRYAAKGTTPSSC
jgi:2',3'-cyclic-nucleotide 2'-phosphodiesterase (5'-nucleotidase family)